MVHCRRALAGTEVPIVVQVAAVSDVRKPALGAESLHLREEFVLAVEAALRVVALVVRIGELVGRERFYRDRVLCREGQCRRKLRARKRSRVSNDSEHARAKYLVRDECEISGVGSSGVRDEKRLKRGELLEKRGVLPGELRRNEICGHQVSLARCSSQF
jgi:hypothetical protein